MEFKKNQKREMNLKIEDSNSTERTVSISFSSETPYGRYYSNGQYYNEILLHGPENVDLSRLNDGASLLFNHEYDQLIGVHESARVDTDRVGRAVVRFSNSALAEEKYQQVLEGVLTKVSVGYEIQDYYIDGDNLYVTRWQPVENSFVTVPADPTVGLNRSLEEPEQNSSANSDADTEQKSTTPDDAEQPAEDNSQEIEESEGESTASEETEDSQDESNERAQEDGGTESESATEVSSESQEDDSDSINKDELEKERIAELEGMARNLNIDVSDAIAKGLSVDEFAEELIKNNKPQINKDVNTMEKSYLSTALRAFSDEGDISDLNHGKRGVVIPATSLRAVSTSTAANLIQDTIKYDSYIDILRANSVLANFDLTVISGLEGDGKLSLPALSSDFTEAFGFVAEDGTSPEATPAFGKVTLEPTDFTGSVYLTRLMMQSASAAERYTTDAMLKGAATQLEKHVMSEVVAAAVTAGNVENVAALVNIDFDAVVDAMGTLGAKNVQSSRVVAVMSPKTRSALRKQVVKGNTSAKFLVEGQGADQLLAGEIPVIESTLVDDNQVILGDFSQIVIAQWGDSVELDRDDTTSRNRGGLYLRVWATMDTAVARPEAFYVIRVGA